MMKVEGTRYSAGLGEIPFTLEHPEASYLTFEPENGGTITLDSKKGDVLAGATSVSSWRIVPDVAE